MKRIVAIYLYCATHIRTQTVSHGFLEWAYIVSRNLFLYFNGGHNTEPLVLAQSLNRLSGTPVPMKPGENLLRA